MSVNPSIQVVPASALLISVLAHGLLLGVLANELSNQVWTKSGTHAKESTVQLTLQSVPSPKPNPTLKPKPSPKPKLKNGLVSQSIEDSSSKMPVVQKRQKRIEKKAHKSSVLTVAESINKREVKHQGVRHSNVSHSTPQNRSRIQPLKTIEPSKTDNKRLKSLPLVNPPSLIHQGADTKSRQAQGAIHSGMQLGTLKASPIHIVKPHYPTTSRRRGEEGQVSIWVSLDANGQVQKLKVISSSHHNLLDKAALKAAKETRFVPEKRNGKAMPSHYELHYRFSLNGL
jgi:protein TonB